MVRHFKSRRSYRKFNAYVHIHHLVKHHPKYVVIHGRRHRVRHRRR